MKKSIDVIESRCCRIHTKNDLTVIFHKLEKITYRKVDYLRPYTDSKGNGQQMLLLSILRLMHKCFGGSLRNAPMKNRSATFRTVDKTDISVPKTTFKVSFGYLTTRDQCCRPKSRPTLTGASVGRTTWWS